jgi:hypothetical protein
MKYYQSRKSDALADLTAGSQYMHQISRPLTVNTNDVTQYRYNIIKHPTLDDYAIAIDESDLVNVHHHVQDDAANNRELPLTTAFVNNASETARLKGLAQNSSHINGNDLAPARWDEKTYSQLDSDGFFE